jgi:hypothetical protein
MNAEEFADRVAKTFGNKPARAGREWRCHCPVHEADGQHTPSLAIWEKGPGRFAWKCMVGCSQEAVRAALKKRGVPVGFDSVSVEQALQSRIHREEHRVESLTKASEFFRQSRPIELGDPAYTYLAGRGLFDDYNELDTLRTIPMPEPALLGVITDLSTLRDEIPSATGVAILPLDEHGVPNTDEKSGKKFRTILGAQRGYGVPYGMIGPHLLVAEGIETMLAGMELLSIPFGVATLSASNMLPLAVPEWVTHVTICADNDSAGVEAAAALATDLGHCGVKTRIERWGDYGSGWDANDELMRRKK